VIRLTLLALIVAVAPLATTVLVLAARRQPAAQIAAILGATVTAGGSVTLAAAVLIDPRQHWLGSWLVVDPAGAILLAAIGLVGWTSIVFSPVYLATKRQSFFRLETSWRPYYACLLVFWSALLAIPIAGSLGIAWLLIESTTAASALLVGFSGKTRALEAGWKYLVLTTLGLGIALLGIVLLQVAQQAGSAGSPGLSYHGISAHAARMPHDATLLAYVLILTGLAAKIGWAPVHNWLPDAHSEAPPPVSALLSAALLPTVILVAWRVQQALAPAIGTHASRNVFLIFGLMSLAVAVPFLWRPMAWKRLLAYSSLEHMGVIALGIGFGQPLAIAGVAVHIVGHALAKSLGFLTAIPLLAAQPRTGQHPPRRLGRHGAGLSAAVGASLAVLAGVPPSPLFVSELLIALGGIRAGHLGVVVVATVLLALGFLGLSHHLIDAVPGRRRPGEQARIPALRGIGWLTLVTVALLLALAAAAPALPGSEIVTQLAKGLS
jgi:hydrogenase-4 component F